MKLKNLFLLWWNWKTIKATYEAVIADEEQKTKRGAEIRMKLREKSEDFQEGMLTAYRLYGLLATQNPKDLKKDLKELQDFLE